MKPVIYLPFLDICIVILTMLLVNFFGSWFILLAVVSLGFQAIKLTKYFKLYSETDRNSDILSGNIALIFIALVAVGAVALKIGMTSETLMLIALGPIVVKTGVFFAITLPRLKFIKYAGRITSFTIILYAFLWGGFTLSGLVQAVPGIILLFLSELAKFKRWPGFILIFFPTILSYYALNSELYPALLIVYVILTTIALSLGITALRKVTEFPKRWTH